MTFLRHSWLLLLATTALLLEACSGVDGSDGRQDDTQAAPQAVSFDVYVNRNTTRGGATGTLTVDGAGSTTSLQAVGFGVLAYYTNDQLYNQLSLPNFMYNQQVVWLSSAWTYSPVKYWPNETGTGAQNIGADRLSFFAYAPYTDVDATTGRATTNPATGIASLTRPNEPGDPYVRYYASFTPAECVDLCWAPPTLDMTKPATSTPVNFTFQHALSALNVQIDADVDAADGTHDNSVAGDTRIYVRSITFEGFATKGQLNLHTGDWYNLDCDCDVTSLPVTIYDGRRDGHEGMAASLNERPTGLNPVIVQSGPYSTSPTFTSPTPGVTNVAVNLFNSAAGTAPVYVIPTQDPLKVTIVYDVETFDDKLVTQHLADGRTHGSSIKNTITAYIKTSADANITMEAGKQYTIGLHLGMTSVKVDAEVTPWPEEGTNATVNLPNNE